MIRIKYVLFVFAILGFLISCNETDENERTTIEVTETLEHWPLKQGNQWIFSKDTLVDTLRIDTLIVNFNQNLFQAKKIKKFLLPNSLQLDSLKTYFLAVDSTLLVKIPSNSFSENNVDYNYSEISIPIYNSALNLAENYSGVSEFSKIENGILQNINIDYDIRVIDKNVMEAIGGRVFQNITKVENTYTLANATTLENIENFTLSIWLQPGIGPVKIEKNNTDSIYLLHNYQIVQ